MKNILLILPYGGVGGMERVALNFYNYYKGKGYNIQVIKIIGLKTDIINFGKDEIVLSRKDLFELSSIQRLLFYFMAALKIRKSINNNNITTSIAFGDVANLLSAFTFTKEHKIASIHSFKSVELSFKNLLNKLTKLGYKTYYKNFDKVVCISMATKKDLIENCGYKFISNLKVIYNPHDLEQITELSKVPILDINENLIFKNDVVLFLGRLSPVKATWHLINAFSHVKNKDTTNLVFIGDGDDLIIKHLQNLIAHYELQNRVHFFGRKSNPYMYLSKAKALALTSHYEGTPNVIVEAISLNIPVVSSFCSQGIPELMSLNPNIKESNENIKVEGGIITPNLYKGSMEVPNSILDITDQEIQFSEALLEVLTNKQWKTKLKENSNKLTEKFNLAYVCNSYLE